ncbi:MAG: 50S ribosomal protein L22 [Patescibacteria group bacterium]
MEITAQVKFARISPKKVKPLLGNLRRRPVTEVLNSLRYVPSKAGRMVYKLINSAVANATNNYNFKTDNLKIKLLTVDEGPRHKRYWLRSHGAADVKLKRMAHLNVVLEEIAPVVAQSKDKSLSSASVKPVVSPDKTKSTASENHTPAAPTPTPANKPKKGLSAKRLFTRTTNK